MFRSRYAPIRYLAETEPVKFRHNLSRCKNAQLVRRLTGNCYGAVKMSIQSPSV
jgi:hypothetical protein